MKQGEAERAIREAGFVPDVRVDATSTEPKGTVVDQIPVGGTADQGSTVTIFVSAYEEPIGDPDGDADRDADGDPPTRADREPDHDPAHRRRADGGGQPRATPASGWRR